MSVPSIGEPNKPSVALAFSAAEVRPSDLFLFVANQVHLQAELWCDSFISCETAAASKAGKRSTTFIKTVNKMTGKESMKASNFNQANWGAVMSDYLSSIKKNLSGSKKFDNIIQEAMSFAKLCWWGESTATSSTAPEHEVGNERVLLADDSNEDDNN